MEWNSDKSKIAESAINRRGKDKKSDRVSGYTSRQCMDVLKEHTEIEEHDIGYRHLKVSGMRKLVKYILDKEGVDYEE